MKQPFFKLIFASFVFFMILSSSSINAAHYEFSQKGFDEGGIVTGSFEGEDVFGGYDENGENAPDGMIVQCYGRGCGGNWIDFSDEVTIFNINFSGNSFFESLNATRAGLNWLSYDLNTNDLELSYSYPTTTGGDSLGDLVYLSNDWSGENGIVTLSFQDNFEWHWVESVSTESIKVTQTPLPSAFNLFFIGLALLLGKKRPSLAIKQFRFS